MADNAPTPSPQLSREDDVRENKDLAALSYVWIFSIIVFALKANHSPFIRYHSRQGMLLFLLSILVAFVPFVAPLLEIGVLAGCIWGFILAAQGLWADVPFVGPLAHGKLTLRQSWKELVNGIAKAYQHSRSAMRNKPKNESTGDNASQT